MITTVDGPDDNPQPSEGLHVDDGQTFEQLAEQMPETAQGFLDSVQQEADRVGSADDGGSLIGEITAPAPDEQRRKVNVSKKVRKAMNRLKGKVAEVPIMWFHTQAKANPEWELDNDEKEMLTDAISTVFDVLDIEFEIEPLTWTLTSIWWVIGYPVLAFAFLFLSKKSLTIDKEQHADAE